MKFTDRSIETVRCPDGRKDALLFDDVLKGFGLRVTTSGRRVFIFQYRVGQRVRRTVLGYWGSELTTAQARRKAEALRGQVRDGRDPVSERKAAVVEKAAAETAAKAAVIEAAYTVDALISDWTLHHLAHRSAGYRRRVPVEMRRALHALLDTPATAVDRAAAVKVLDAAKAGSGPVAANRLHAEVRACWGWAVKRGSLPTNPWSAAPRPLQRERPRERILTDDEVGALYAAVEALSEPWNVLIRLLILTGQRRGEVSGMRWDELDLEAGRWSLPGVRTKNGSAHVVPLTSDAVALLRSVKRRQGSVFVFEGRGGVAMSGFTHVKARLEALLTEAMKGSGRDPAPWVLHDLRRTMATGLQRLGVRLEVTEALLNHVSGSRAGIVGVYQQHSWAKEKVDALTAWNAHVINVASVRLRPGRTPAKQSNLLVLVS